MSYPKCAALRRVLKTPGLLAVTTAVLLFAGAAGAVDHHHTRVDLDSRHFDARAQRLAFEAPAPQTPEQLQALEALRVEVPGLMARFDPATGVTRTLSHPTGYVTGASPDDHLEIAIDWVQNNARALGLSPADVQHFEVTDNVYSAATGASHIYLRQTHRNIPLYNGQLHVNVNRDGKILSVNNAFMPSFAQSVNNHRPTLTAAQAVARAAEHIGLDVATPQALGPGRGARQVTPIDPSGISTEPIEASLLWVPVERGDARLAWNFQIVTEDGQHWFDFTVDGHEGSIWTRFDWVADGTYNVYKEPDESPLHGTTGRTLVVDPEESVASPNGWFAGGSMDGNNVHACPDTNGNNACDSNPQCSGTTCDFAINLNQEPSTYIPAAVANLFYWNNLVHDVQYQYGFDEVGGNFQEDNFGRGGAGSDSVNADAQDGSGTCNANFATPTDGGNPRMQMFVCGMTSPTRDGDLDNGVIVHEYGHGISIRQVGGPGNSSCLNNSQQPGEGWSDWFGLVYTAEVGDAGTDSRGIGTYLFGQGPNGPGIRDLPYSTDPAINNWTYESIGGASIPHGVGSRWAQAIWEVYWALVDKHGFSPGDQLLDPVGGGWTGSHRAMLYVNEGLKNTACSPTFLDTRDGIIQAATDNFGGEDVCTLWDAFAAFGLGTDASTGGSNSTSATNGFSVPLECQCSPQAIADAGPDQNICLGDSATVGTPAQAGHTYSWSPGGQTTAQITVSPSVDTTYTVTATTSCGSASDSATVFVDDGTTPAGLNDDFEGDNSDWTTTGLWHQVTDSACPSPSLGYSSPLNAFYYGQDASCTYDTGAANSGTLTSPPISGITATSTLTFDYWRQVESFNGDFDRTQVNILAGGSTTVFSLNASNASQAAWVSSGPIDLSAFAGQTIQVQFVFDTVDNVSNNFTGWLIDDVVVTGESSCTPTGDQPPTATINSPADGSAFDEGDTISFSGTASDAEDGDLTASLSWTSSLDGAIGSGGSFSTVLSVGTHTITASVTDSNGSTGSDSITVTVNPNTPPTVNITAPADGSSFVEGASVTFTGNASDTQDGDLTASLSWTSSLDGAIGSGGSFSTSTLSLGTHTITASVTDSGGLSGSDSITVDIVEDTGQCTDCIDWNVTGTVSYSNQDVAANVTVEDAGATLLLQDNTWRRTTQTFTLGPDTVLEFEYASTSQGEIHGIGFDENDTLNDAPRHYQIWGTQNWTGTGRIRETAQQYSGSGNFETFQIPVGQDLNGTFFLVLINDNDAGTGNNGRFRNVRVFEDTPEPPPPGTCAADVDFEDGTSNGWTTSGTCTTGTFTVGTPNQITNGGVVTQLGGDHTTGTGNAWFTQPNSSAGVDDVDGGECITTSPTFAVGEASDVSVWYYHGQRDAGDDPAGDFFFLEISRDSGATWSTLASFGDVTVNAAWTQATTTAAAGENVRFRVRASDGSAAGDLVEAGIDDVQICPTP